MIVAAPFILTTVVVASIIIFRRRQDRRELRKRQEGLFGDNPTPLQMEDNTIQKPETAAAAKVGSKTGMNGWQEAPLRGGPGGSPWKNPWES